MDPWLRIRVFLQIFYSVKEKFVLKRIGENFELFKRISDLETCMEYFVHFPPYLSK